MWLLYIVAFFGALQFLVAPLLVYMNLKNPAEAPWTHWDLTGKTKPRLASQIKDTILAELAPLGFEIVGGLQGIAENIEMYEVHCGAVHDNDRASVATMIITSSNQEQRFVEFVTDFSGGSQITTSNVELPGAFIPRPGCQNFHYPEIKDISLLYRLHKAAGEKYGSGAVSITGQSQTLPERRNAEEAEIVEHQIACKRLKRRRDGSVSPTLLGAFQMTWLMAFPIAQVRKAFRNRKLQNLRNSLTG
ncbi:MAG: hypothetical protein JKY56_04155 [Kofleriaceae bacterium]|nr:hypothetical protein [Kofleriaceae bacterium]